MQEIRVNALVLMFMQTNIHQIVLFCQLEEHSRVWRLYLNPSIALQYLQLLDHLVIIQVVKRQLDSVYLIMLQLLWDMPNKNMVLKRFAYLIGISIVEMEHQRYSMKMTKYSWFHYTDSMMVGSILEVTLEVMSLLARVQVKGITYSLDLTARIRIQRGRSVIMITYMPVKIYSSQ